MRVSNNRKKGSGFTLIEVLIIVSIIAFITTAAIYYINDAREKARMAGALSFSASLKRSLAANLISYWPFDVINGNTTPDIWGKKDGTLVNGPVLVDGKFGKAIQFNGNNYVKYTGGVVVNGDKITLSAWVSHDGTGNYYKNIVARGDTDYGIALSPNKRPFFELYNGTQGKWLAFGKSLKANTWYHIAGVYDGSKINMYVDGLLQEPSIDNSYSGNIMHTGTDLDTTIGSGHIGGWTQYFNGLIDDVQIYDSALTAMEIQKIYAEGLKKHGLAIK